MTAMANSCALPVKARLGLTAIFFANGFGIGSWATVIAPLKTMLVLSDAQLSIVLLTMAAGAIVMMPLAGMLAKRLGGTGRLLQLSSALFGVALALPALAPSLPMCALATLLLGLANGVMEVPMNAHATVIERNWGAAIMSSFHAAWSCGGLAGAALGGLLIHLGATPTWQLAAASLAVLSIVAPSALLIGAGELGYQANALVWPERKLVGLCAIALLALLVEGAMTDWSTVYLTSVLALSPAAAAGGYAAYAAAMLTGRLFGDFCVRLIGRYEIILLGAGLTAAGLLVAVIGNSQSLAITGMCLVGLGLSNMIPAVFSASGALGSSPALGISMTATAGYCGFLLGPPAIGAISSYGGLRLAFMLLVLSMLAILLLASATRRAGSKSAG